MWDNWNRLSKSRGSPQFSGAALVTKNRRARFTHRPVSTLVVVVSLLIAACSAGNQPQPTVTPSYTGPGVLERIASGTQLHLRGLAVGAGNFWTDDYVDSDGAPKRGPTAALFISVLDDPSRNQTFRV